MAMKRCPQGHYYDPAKHTSCPVCGVDGLEIGVTAPRRGMGQAVPAAADRDLDAGATRPLGGAPAEGSAPDVGPTRDMAAMPAAPETPLTTPAPEAAPAPEDDATRRVIYKDVAMDPVVGWLVCVKGPDRGRDYRIKSERNFIGRSGAMDVCIRGDDSISRERHAVLSFNPKNLNFRIMPGDSFGMVYLNGEEVSQPTDLKPRDVIELGKTQLLFVPLCDDTFQWTE